jgi:hypothetical protein
MNKLILLLLTILTFSYNPATLQSQQSMIFMGLNQSKTYGGNIISSSEGIYRPLISINSNQFSNYVYEVPFLAVDSNGKSISDVQFKINGQSVIFGAGSFKDRHHVLNRNIVLLFDNSPSMLIPRPYLNGKSPLDLAKDAARQIINDSLLKSKFSFAIMMIDKNPYFALDFRKVDNQLFNAIDKLNEQIFPLNFKTAFSGNFASVFFSPQSTIIFFTDGNADFAGIESINRSDANRIIPYVMSPSAPPAYYNSYFYFPILDGIVNDNTNRIASKALINILNNRGEFKLLSFERSSEGSREIEFSAGESVKKSLIFDPVIENQQNLSQSFSTYPVVIGMNQIPGRIQTDTVISLIAKVNVNVTIFCDNPDFEFIPSKLNIPANSQQLVRIRLKKADNVYRTGKVIIGDNSFYIKSGWSNQISEESRITILTPKAGDTLSSGTPVPIRWKGTLPFERVRIDFSTNNGADWSLIADSAFNNSFIWYPDSNYNSSNCLFRISQNPFGSSVKATWPLTDFAFAKRAGRSSDFVYLHPDSNLVFSEMGAKTEGQKVILNRPIYKVLDYGSNNQPGVVGIEYSDDSSAVLIRHFDNWYFNNTRFTYYSFTTNKFYKTNEEWPESMGIILGWKPGTNFLYTLSGGYGLIMFRTINPDNGQIVNSDTIINNINLISAIIDRAENRLYFLTRTGSMNRLYAYDLQNRKILNSVPVQSIQFPNSTSRSDFFAEMSKDRIFSLTDNQILDKNLNKIGTLEFDNRKYYPHRCFWNPLLSKLFIRVQDRWMIYDSTGKLSDQLTVNANSDQLDSWSFNYYSGFSGNILTYTKNFVIDRSTGKVYWQRPWLQQSISQGNFRMEPSGLQIRDIRTTAAIVKENTRVYIPAFLSNKGLKPIQIDSIAIKGPRNVTIAPDLQGKVLQPGESADLIVYNLPDTAGIYTINYSIGVAGQKMQQAIITVPVENAVLTDEQSISFSPWAGDVLYPGFQKLGNVLRNATPDTVRIKSYKLLGPADTEFNFVGYDLPKFVLPGGYLSINVNYYPRISGRRSARLFIDYEGSKTPAIIHLMAENLLSDRPLNVLDSPIDQQSETGIPYPNPANEYIYFLPGNTVKAELYTVQGVSIATVYQSNEIRQEYVQLPVSDYPSGAYLLRLSRADGSMQSFRLNILH